MLLRAASVALSLLLLLAGTARADPPSGGPAPVAEPARQPASGTAAPQLAAPRPKIGLVLSGGGARGLAHVGVLKVLERERIPVDVIAGTSMGAIIGGLYASGMKADEIEQEILRIDWDRLFAQRVSRQQLSQRRKEEDFDIATAVELGWRDGEFRAPQSAVSSRGLETLLRRFTLPVARIQRFDALPTPFRAVATDMETGAAVVLDHGDLALALRSSMSVPGVFSATEWEGRLLGDGGLVNNVPVDVARAMGAERLIVVNIGTPLAARDTLSSALGLTAQMINILTEQNVQRSLASLGPQDLLLSPDLGKLTAGDFNRATEFIQAGQTGAEQARTGLAGWGLRDTEYLAWQAQRQPDAPPAPVLDYVRFEGSQGTHPERFAAQLQSQPGQPFEPDKAAADTRTLAASGDYLRTDYRLEQTERGQGLVLDLEDKPWGPNFLRVGLDLDTDFSGRSAFNLKLSHNRHWLTPTGTEWRNRVQIGEVPSLSTELYHPLNWTLGPANDWFVSLHGLLQRETRTLYNPLGTREVGQVRRTRAQWGLDLGQPWGSFGEFRLGLLQRGERVTPVILGAGYQGSPGVDTWTETGLRLQVVVDQLDFANFPLNGYRIQGEAVLGQHQEPERSRIGRLELQGTLARSWGRQTLTLHTEVRLADTPERNSYGGGYSLGGFQHLSGYRPGQIAGDAVLFTRLGGYTRLPNPPFFARGWFLGGTLEAGQAWDTPRQLRLRGLRGGGSLYLGADTGIGPMYLGLTFAPQGEPGVALMIGRP